jgi:cytokinesis protein
MLGTNLNVLLSARKDMPFTPNSKMKQLQWDKLPHQQVGKTLWKDEEPEKEKEIPANFNLMECGWKWRRISRPSS